MQRMIAQFRTWLGQSEFRFQLFRGGGISLVIQVGFAAFSFVSATVLARFLGSHSYGAFTNAQSWTGVLIPIATMGFGNLLVRDTSVYKVKKEWGALRGLFTFSNRFVSLSSLLLILLIFGVSFLIYPSAEALEMRSTLWVALLLVPMEALILLRQGTIRGLEHVARSLLPDQIIRPLLLLIGVVGLYLALPRFLSAPVAMLVSSTAAVVALLIASHWQKKLTPPEVFRSAPVFHSSDWFKTAFPMMLSASLNLVLMQASPIMLGIMDTPSSVALYSAAYKIAFLANFILQAVGYVIAPIVARLYAGGEKAKLQKLLNTSTRITSICGLALSVVFILSGRFLLSLFGPEFTNAYSTLLILVLCNQLDIMFGFGNLLLTMTGHQKFVAFIFGLSSIVNIILNVILISRMSFEGAAIASTISLIICRMTLTIYSKRKMGVNPSIG